MPVFLSGSLIITGSITTSGTITAQTLVVQTITASVVQMTGSNTFGSLLTDRQTFTGSMYVTGSTAYFAGNIYVGGTSFGSDARLGISNNNREVLELNPSISSNKSRILSYNRSSSIYTSMQLEGSDFDFSITGSTGKFIINSSGNVGISASPSAWVSPFNVIQGGTYGQHIGFQTNGPDIKVGSNNYYNGSGYLYTTSNGAAQLNVGGNSGYQFNIAPSGTAGAPVNFTASMVITSAGNVGIGNASPSFVLDVSASVNNQGIRINSVQAAVLYLYSNYNDAANRNWGIFNNSQVFGDFDIRQSNAKDGNMTIGANSTSRLYISSSGAVSFGGSVSTNNYIFSQGEGNGFLVESGTALTARTGFMKYGGFEGMLVSGNSTKVRLCHRTDSDFVYGGTPTIREDLVIATTGAVTIAGSLSKGSGTFKINHPLEFKKDTHYLVHSFVEGPRADLIYRGKVTLVDGLATINIDESATMTEGTFVALNRDIQCFTTNESGWDLVKGKVEGNILTITSNNPNSTDEISWMVIGERQDEHIKNTDWTDINGKPILEPLKLTTSGSI